MSKYQYPESRVVDEIIFKKNERDSVRAYLHAAPNVDPLTVRTVIENLRSEGYECIPFDLHGKPVVEVRGFHQEAKIIDQLRKHDWITGTPAVTPDPTDNIGWQDKLKKRSLQASGAAMMLADSNFAIYGAKEKNIDDFRAGLAYLAGSTTFLTYGRNDQSRVQIRELSNMILERAEEKGFDIPKDSAVAATGIKRHEGALKKVDRFFKENPSEIGNMMYVVAGSLIAKSALQKRVFSVPRLDMDAEQIGKMRKSGWGDTLLGASTIASGLIATLVKEKKHDPNLPKSHGLQVISDWVQESPLRAAGIGYMVSTLFHACTTFVDHREATRVIHDKTIPEAERILAGEKLKAIPSRIWFVAATLVGELLLAISSKGHGEGVVSDNSVDMSVVAIAADLIVKQPKEMQNDLIEHMGTFLGRQDVLSVKNQDATAMLRRQVEIMRNNPWALAEKDENAPMTVPVFTTKKSIPNWQTKINTPPNELHTAV